VRYLVFGEGKNFVLNFVARKKKSGQKKNQKGK
jgi:hypothetical protein